MRKLYGCIVILASIWLAGYSFELFPMKAVTWEWWYMPQLFTTLSVCLLGVVHGINKVIQ